MPTPRANALLAAFLALALGLALATPAAAAGPRVILVYGSLLDRPVALSDWAENARLLGDADSGVQAAPELAGRRPCFHFALFSVPDWVRYLDEGRPLAALRPEWATERGRPCPAWGDLGAA